MIERPFWRAGRKLFHWLVFCEWRKLHHADRECGDGRAGAQASPKPPCHPSASLCSPAAPQVIADQLLNNVTGLSALLRNPAVTVDEASSRVPSQQSPVDV
jgi:hypothetical protein